jgi:Ca2+-binding EF-hand superfamily protein
MVPQGGRQILAVLLVLPQIAATLPPLPEEGDTFSPVYDQPPEGATPSDFIPYEPPVVDWGDAFPKVDHNGDGFVTEKELLSYMKKGSLIINEKQRQEMHPAIRKELANDIAVFLREADNNGDGLLTREEIGADDGTVNHDLAFGLADENQDGQLNYDEVMIYHYPDLSMNRQAFYEYETHLHFTEFDTDKDGFVTFEEYMNRKDVEHEEHMKAVFDEPSDENSISEEDRLAWREYDIKSFQYSDASKDGKLDGLEMLEMVQTSGRDLQTESHEIFSLMDENSDSKVTLSEMKGGFEHMTSLHEFFQYHDEI